MVYDVTHRVATVENPRLHRQGGIRERYNSTEDCMNLRNGWQSGKQDREQMCEHLCLGESSLHKFRDISLVPIHVYTVSSTKIPSHQLVHSSRSNLPNSLNDFEIATLVGQWRIG